MWETFALRSIENEQKRHNKESVVESDLELHCCVLTMALAGMWFWWGQKQITSFLVLHNLLFHPSTNPQVWLCGGSMEVLPCSRVAHIARMKKPYHSNIAFHTRRNALRVAEVWMDEYKSNVYLAWNIPMEVRGGVEARVEGGWLEYRTKLVFQCINCWNCLHCLRFKFMFHFTLFTCYIVPIGYYFYLHYCIIIFTWV